MPTTTPKTVDADGTTLHEGDRVFTYDIFGDRDIYGTLYKNVDHPEVSEWYVKYDDGEGCAVLDFGQIWKALKNKNQCKILSQ